MLVRAFFSHLLELISTKEVDKREAITIQLSEVSQQLCFDSKLLLLLA